MLGKKIKKADIKVLVTIYALGEEQLTLLKKLRRKNRPVQVRICDVKELMGDYSPMITGQSIKNDIFICRRAGKHCMISLRPDFWSDLGHAWWLCIRCTIFERKGRK